MGPEWETHRVNGTIVAAGSLGALGAVFRDNSLLGLPADADIVVLPTAASFTGVAEAAVAVAQVCNEFDVRIEALMVTDRASSAEPYFVGRLVNADAVILCDGSALHAKTVWRNSPVGDALKSAARLIAIGSVASVLAEVMIDPRGGAPTIGLGLFSDVAIATTASDDQLARTRSLVGEEIALVVLGPLGIVERANGAWRVVAGDDVIVTRGSEVSAL